MDNGKKQKKQEKPKKQKSKMMQTQLTDREKSLLYVLAIMLILIVGVKYIIAPTYQKMAELKIQDEDVQMKEAATLATIEGLETTKLETERLMIQIRENSKNISTFLNDEGVDNLITKLCIENNLKPIALAIESDPYDKFDMEKMPETPASQGEAPTEEVAATETAAVKYTRSAKVNLILQGSKQSMLGFIDKINSVPYLLVESFTSSFSESAGTLPGGQTHSIKIKINMLNTEFK
ncbi:MAG: hypothetical protein WBH44_00085 [Proteocatella sp.]